MYSNWGSSRNEFEREPRPLDHSLLTVGLGLGGRADQAEQHAARKREQARSTLYHVVFSSRAAQVQITAARYLDAMLWPTWSWIVKLSMPTYWRK